MSTFRIDLSDVLGNLDLDDDITEQVIEDVHTKIGLDLQARLMLATPIDTGEARNGWQLDAQGKQTVIENRVPHITALNNGHSKQAPAGFVENVIDAVVKGR